MPRTLKLLALVLPLAAPTCAHAAAHPLRQTPAATQRSPTTDEELERGKRLLEQGNATAAVPMLKRAAERRKTDADAWYHLGLALGHVRKPKDARKAFERAVKLRPDWADAHAGLAFTMLTLGKPRDAEPAARRALAADPQHGGAHYVVGHVRFDEEKFTEALAGAEAALRARPDFAAAAYLAADALLNVYVEESARQGRQHPLPPATSPEERKALLARREPALAPFKARMLELADRLDSFAAAHPDARDAENWRTQAESLRIYGRTPADGGFPGLVPPDQLTTKAVITFKPEPGYPEEARRNHVSGTIRLRAVLGADGKVRHIVPIKRLSDGLTEKAVEAARLIKFKPATMDGHPVSQYVVLEYTFNIY
jgi:TonB family protein